MEANLVHPELTFGDTLVRVAQLVLETRVRLLEDFDARVEFPCTPVNHQHPAQKGNDCIDSLGNSISFTVTYEEPTTSI